MKKDRGGGLLSRAAAIISLAIVVFLMSGYLGFAGKIHLFGASPATGRLEYLSITFGDGRVRSSFNFDSSGSPPKLGYGFFWDPPDFIRSFQQGFAFAALGSKPGLKRFNSAMFDCPIWFAILPFLVAPLRWLRKRRRAQPAGFDVVASSK